MKENDKNVKTCKKVTNTQKITQTSVKNDNLQNKKLETNAQM